MKFDNLIKLKTWRVETDKHGSEFEIIDDEIIAVKMKQAKQINDKDFTFNNVKIFLNDSFDERIFKISKCREFQITYKTNGNNPIAFGIEENMNTYDFYYILPSSKEWITKIIKIENLVCVNNNKSKPDLKNVTGFIFNFNSNEKKEIIDNLYIKEFIVKGYEVVSLKTYKSPVYKKYIMKKSFLNSAKLHFLKNKKQKYQIYDSRGNPLYCIYPFYQFLINLNFYSVCCWTSLKENFKIDNNNMLDVWYSKEFDKIRNCIRDLSYSECNIKNCMEIIKFRKIFKNLNEIKKEYPDIADYLEGKTEKFRELPKYIIAGFDETCNLNCKSCTVSNKEKQPLEVSQKYIQEIEKVGKNIEKLLIAGYGDPFASPSYRNWLHNFPNNKFPKLKMIEFLTNAILWTEKNWKNISRNINKYHIEGIISIDGATKETYEYNRGNAKFETLTKNLEYVSELRKKNELKSLVLRFVVQKNNYTEIPLMIEFARKYLFDRIVFFEILNWGSYNTEEFNKINIFDKKHKEYKKLFKIYKKVKETKYDDIIINFGFKL